MTTIFNRIRFRYSLGDIFRYFSNCACLRKNRLMAANPDQRKHVLFKKGSEKLADELDCVTIIKSIRMLKLLT